MPDDDLAATRTWRDLQPKDMVDKKLPWEGIEGPMNELGERCPWPWDPQQLVGAPLGQYHCPYCGGMQVAGTEHLDFSGTCIACLGHSDPDNPCPFCGGTGEARHNLRAVPIHKMDAGTEPIGFRFSCSCGREGNGTHRTYEAAMKAGCAHIPEVVID